MDFICQLCQTPFFADDKRRKFCSVACAREWHRTHLNKGGFKKGMEPWNKGVKGLHLSPATEFKKGDYRPTVPIGTVRIRQRRNRQERPRAWIKVGEPNEWRMRAVMVWERYNNRTVPVGFIVHHENRDSLDDDPRNLTLMTRSAHMKEHRAEFEEQRRIAAASAASRRFH